MGGELRVLGKNEDEDGDEDGYTFVGEDIDGFDDRILCFTLYPLPNGGVLVGVSEGKLRVLRYFPIDSVDTLRKRMNEIVNSAG